LILLSLFSF